MTKEQIKQILKDQNLTQQQLAKITGYSVQHINYVINGKRPIGDKLAKELEKLTNEKEQVMNMHQAGKFLIDFANGTNEKEGKT